MVNRQTQSVPARLRAPHRSDRGEVLPRSMPFEPQFENHTGCRSPRAAPAGRTRPVNAGNLRGLAQLRDRRRRRALLPCHHRWSGTPSFPAAAKARLNVKPELDRVPTPRNVSDFRRPAGSRRTPACEPTFGVEHCPIIQRPSSPTSHSTKRAGSSGSPIRPNGNIGATRAVNTKSRRAPTPTPPSRPHPTAVPDHATDGVPRGHQPRCGPASTRSRTQSPAYD